MSYADAPGRLSMLADNVLHNSPRIVLTLAIIIAWAMTLAWPPPPADFQPKVDLAETQNPDYIVRIALPASEPVETQELAQLVKQHESLARLDLDLPELDEGEFEGAFGALLPPPAASRAGTVTGAVPQLEPGEVLDLDYDLARLEPASEQFDPGDGSLTVKKPLYIDGANSGSATIRIEEGAQILINTSALANALGDRVNRLPARLAGALAQGDGFIPFYELRAVGIAVEYDPVTDRISLSMPS